MSFESISSIASDVPIVNIDRTTAKNRLEKLKQRQQERLIDYKTPEEEKNFRKEIIEANPQNILVVCHAGVFRSGMVAKILNERGYSAENTGTMRKDQHVSESLLKYDAIIFMSKNREREFKELYDIEEFSIPTRQIGIAESANLHDPKTIDIEIQSAETKLDSLGFLDKNSTEELHGDH